MRWRPRRDGSRIHLAGGLRSKLTDLTKEVAERPRSTASRHPAGETCSTPSTSDESMSRAGELPLRPRWRVDQHGAEEVR